MRSKPSKYWPYSNTLELIVSKQTGYQMFLTCMQLPSLACRSPFLPQQSPTSIARPPLFLCLPAFVTCHVQQQPALHQTKSIIACQFFHSPRAAIASVVSGKIVYMPHFQYMKPGRGREGAAVSSRSTLNGQNAEQFGCQKSNERVPFTEENNNLPILYRAKINADMQHS
eukprot:1158490-Pelagomonas_calceolata.AAC.3